MAESLCEADDQISEDGILSVTKSAKVQFVLQDNLRQRQILLVCPPNETILSTKVRLAEIIGTDPALLRVIFSGRSLGDGMRLANLELGPTTCLTLTIAAQNSIAQSASDKTSLIWVTETNVVEDETDEGWVKLTDKQEERSETFLADSASANAFSAFYVFCKGCDSLKRAKLRAYCRVCASSAIVFRQEPQCWDDVKENNDIRVFCHLCDGERGVLFRFKCVTCDECSSPLHHISRNSSVPPSDCVICGSHTFPLGVRLSGCAHISCLHCFAAYAEQLLSRMSLKWHAQIGYTIGCPVYGCPAVVFDVHTLYLLGKPAYHHYHQMAAQLFFSSHIAERQHCPWPNCGAAFFVEETDEKSGDQTEEMLLCPECCRLFCRSCCTTDAIATKKCKCPELRGPVDVESASLIRRTAKNCPRCSAPTERNGGCAHIRCTQCQSEWCFICLKLWNDDCQWDHWFE
uniref:RBR-type E3 ubiquitin transferase n=1 Tax=Globodera rostochiensis TaxID=31243 RepID=A0A914HXG9_GLORO